MLDIDAQVRLGRLDACVPEHGADGRVGRPAGEHARSQGVAQGVRPMPAPCASNTRPGRTRSPRRGGTPGCPGAARTAPARGGTRDRRRRRAGHASRSPATRTSPPPASADQHAACLDLRHRDPAPCASRSGSTAEPRVPPSSRARQPGGTGALQAYNLNACAEFPASPRTVFSNAAVYHGFPNFYEFSYPNWIGVMPGYGGPTCHFAVVAASGTLDY